MKIDRLAFSTNAFKQSTLEEAIRTIARLGYRGVEVMADEPHMRPDRTSPTQARELRKLIDGLGLTVTNVNAFTGFCFENGDTYHPTWVEHDPKLRQARVDHTKRAIELTAALGCAHISLQPGGPYLGRDTRELLTTFAEGLNDCVPHARSHGVTLGVEPEPGLLIERSDQFMRFKHQHFPDEPAVQMNCDLGHFFCVREDPAAVIRNCAHIIRHVHLEDIGHQRVHQHLVPGDGVIEYPAILDALDQIGYGGWITVELYPYTASAQTVARRALEHLMPMLST